MAGWALARDALVFGLPTQPPVEAICALVQAFPAAVPIPSRANQDLPIHIACRYQVSKDILQELLLRDFPVTAIEQTRWGRTPLMVL
jgi:hypothetical protein